MTGQGIATGAGEEGSPGGTARGWLLLLGRFVSLFVVLGLMAGLSLGLKVLFDPQVMPIRVARIEGDFRYLKRADLEKAVADVTQASFFGLDVAAIKQATESLPWVARATVRRVWPDSLHILVVEQVPMARWGEASVINAQGGIFTPPADSIPNSLPRLAGPDGSGAQVLAQYQAMSKQLAGAGLAIEQLVMSGRGAWQLKTNSGLLIQLGRDDYRERLAYWLGLYPGLRDSRPQESMQTVDMRYGNGMAVLWQPKVLPSTQTPG